jgi:hypothetical protein
MRVAYITTDEVNQDLAARMAEACGATLDSLSPRDPPPDGQYQAVLFDLDFLPRDSGQVLLAQLLAHVPPRPVAVHSYRLGTQQAAALRRRGCAVYARLEPKVFHHLRSAAR